MDRNALIPSWDLRYDKLGLREEHREKKEKVLGVLSQTHTLAHIILEWYSKVTRIPLY